MDRVCRIGLPAAWSVGSCSDNLSIRSGWANLTYNHTATRARSRDHETCVSRRQGCQISGISTITSLSLSYFLLLGWHATVSTRYDTALSLSFSLIFITLSLTHTHIHTHTHTHTERVEVGETLLRACGRDYTTRGSCPPGTLQESATPLASSRVAEMASQAATPHVTAPSRYMALKRPPQLPKAGWDAHTHPFLLWPFFLGAGFSLSASSTGSSSASKTK